MGAVLGVAGQGRGGRGGQRKGVASGRYFRRTVQHFKAQTIFFLDPLKKPNFLFPIDRKKIAEEFLVRRRKLTFQFF